MVIKTFRLLIAILFFVAPAWAGSDTTLGSPDHDVKRLYPESTTYRMRSWEAKKEASKDVRHSFYAVYKDTALIGLIYGVTSASSGGEIELFTAFNRDGQIRDIYFQKIDSKDAPHFRSKFYRQQYKKFSLGKIPEYAQINPPMRLPQTSVLKDHHLVINMVKQSIDVVKNFYNAAKAPGP